MQLDVSTGKLRTIAEREKVRMRLKLRLPGAAARKWHLALAERLATSADVAVDIELTAEGSGLPREAELLFQLEALLYGLSNDGPAARVSPSALTRFIDSGLPADVTLDLCSEADDGQDLSHGRIWRLLFDGAAGDAALFALLLEGRVPDARIMEGDVVVGAARLGTESRGIALASFEDALARTATLIVAAVKSGRIGRLPTLPDAAESASPPVLPTRRRLAEAAAKQMVRRVIRELYHLCCYAPQWKVGWRRLEGPDLIDLCRHPDTGWHTLPDDGKRFYADPFPIAQRGTVTLFVEDYAHRLGKGIISAVAFDAEGPVGAPRPVLEETGHLSYPLVFERDGEMWMIPESCSAGRVDLFRAVDFPGGWVKEATLLDGVVASDATLVEYGGSWWLFATVRDGGGAFSDALFLWSAPDFRGPFTPHPCNPVLIDIASARPAGRMVMRGGALIRPVQDCRNGYGAALGIARVTRLDQEGFEQKLESIIEPGPAWPGRRLHTLNSAGDLEFIDGSAFARRRWF